MKPKIKYIQRLILVPAIALGSMLLVSCWNEFNDAYDGRWNETQKIAFTSDRDDPNFEIYTMNTDGSGVMRLTDNPSIDLYPSWSPDGSRIAFLSDRDGGNIHIYTMNSDGSDITLISYSFDAAFQAIWSPDGSRIAVIGMVGVDQGLYIMNADGSNPVPFSILGNEMSPSWSPDGGRIVYVNNGGEIYIINAITPQPPVGPINLAECASWSPDGGRIVFQNGTEIYTMDPDGGNIAGPINDTAFPTFPPFCIPSCGWSPDGRIVFTSFRDDQVTPTTEIYVMNADGSRQTRLTQTQTTGVINFYPSWGRLTYFSH